MEDPPETTATAWGRSAVDKIERVAVTRTTSHEGTVMTNDFLAGYPAAKGAHLYIGV